jgi:hypothetical protein
MVQSGGGLAVSFDLKLISAQVVSVGKSVVGTCWYSWIVMGRESLLFGKRKFLSTPQT